VANQESQLRLLTILGAVGISCALLGFLAWIEYGAFATRGIFAAASGQRDLAYRMASCADGFRLVQLLLGVLAVGLGSTKTRGSETRPARALGVAAICLGVVVLALMLLLV